MNHYWHTDSATIYCGDCLDVLPTLAPNSVDAIICDPPYGLSKEPDIREVLQHWLAGDDYKHKGSGFMGKTWDSFVPGPKVWEQCYRVLKPGGYLLCFSSTRTFDLTAIALRMAGFEQHPFLGWVFGCLSEDTEILTKSGWEHYHKLLEGTDVLCYDKDNDTFQWEQIQEVIEYDYEDTAYHIYSDCTDQLVSRNHRCLVERSGRTVFRYAETLQQQESVSILENVSYLLATIFHNQLQENETDVLFHSLFCCTQETELPSSTRKTQREACCLCGMRESNVEAGRLAEEGKDSDLFWSLQWNLAGKGFDETCAQRVCRVDGEEYAIFSQEDVWRKQSCMEGGNNLLSETRELQANQVCQMSRGILANGTKGRLHNGASTACCTGARAVLTSERSGTPQESRSTRQQTGKPGIVCQQSVPQTVRGSRYTTTTLARVEPVQYKGVMWCVRVPSGAFVARRNGKVFVTGNSGFPKASNLGKMLAKDSDTVTSQQWSGWAYGKQSLKPALEPILMFQKPPEGRMVDNVRKWGTGAVNVGDCRVGTEQTISTICDLSEIHGNKWGSGAKRPKIGEQLNPPGRWPANLLLSYPEDEYELRDDVTVEQLRDLVEWLMGRERGEVVGGFPKGKSAHYATPASERSVCYPKNGTIAFTGPKIGWGYNDEGSAARFFKNCPPDQLSALPDSLQALFRPRPNPEKDEVEGGFPESKSRGEYKDSNHKPETSKQLFGNKIGGNSRSNNYANETGSASRYYYCAKSSRADRGEGNDHNTVKPTKLLQYLVRLVTPPGGVVLDNFMGSGSTGVSALREGFRFIGVELDEHYCEIAQRRMEKETSLFTGKSV